MSATRDTAGPGYPKTSAGDRRRAGRTPYWRRMSLTVLGAQGPPGIGNASHYDGVGLAWDWRRMILTVFGRRLALAIVHPNSGVGY